MSARLTLFQRMRATKLHVAAALLICIQALIPNGFMLVSAADGPAIMLCTGQGLQRATLPDTASAAMLAIADAMDTDEVPENDPTPCDYAAASHSVAKLSAIDTPHPPVSTTGAQRIPNGLVAIGHGLAAPPPPQTGPPLTF